MSPKKSNDPREGIDVPSLVKALQRHALGKEEMTSTQVSAAIALLKKVLPDLPAPVRAAESADASHEEALRELE
jgi:hypothetical protein